MLNVAAMVAGLAGVWTLLGYSVLTPIAAIGACVAIGAAAALSLALRIVSADAAPLLRARAHLGAAAQLPWGAWLAFALRLGFGKGLRRASLQREYLPEAGANDPLFAAHALARAPGRVLIAVEGDQALLHAEETSPPTTALGARK